MSVPLMYFDLKPLQEKARHLTHKKELVLSLITDIEKLMKRAAELNSASKKSFNQRVILEINGAIFLKHIRCCKLIELNEIQHSSLTLSRARITYATP